MSHQADAILDACGLNCPEPVMMLHNKVRELPAGGLLKVLATDPSTRRDIPKFCLFLGHELVEQNEENGTYQYWTDKARNAHVGFIAHTGCTLKGMLLGMAHPVRALRREEGRYQASTQSMRRLELCFKRITSITAAQVKPTTSPCHNPLGPDGSPNQWLNPRA